MHRSLLPFLLLASLSACSGDDGEELECGPGTHEDGDTCVADEADTDTDTDSDTDADTDSDTDTDTKDSGDTDTDTDSDTDTDTDSDTDTDTDVELESVLDEIVESGSCDTDPDGGTDTPGFESFTYYLLYGSEASGWTGEMGWVQLANATREANGISDCEIIWDLDASATSPSDCSSCDVGVTFTATVDSSRTDCPADYWEGATSYEDMVSVDLLSTGVAEWYAYGEDAGSGFWTSEGMSGVTDAMCLFPPQG